MVPIHLSKLTWNLNNHQIEIIFQTYIFWVPCKFSRAYVAMHYYLFKGRFWIVVSVSLIFVGVVMDPWMLSWNPMVVDVFCSVLASIVG